MARRLRTYVHVQDERHQAHAFGPDDELPAWAAERITNPKAWEGDEADESTEPTEPNGGDTNAGGTSGDEPPRSGRGSGRDAWAAYAAQHGVTVSDDANRDEIIAALVDAGAVKAE